MGRKLGNINKKEIRKLNVELSKMEARTNFLEELSRDLTSEEIKEKQSLWEKSCELINTREVLQKGEKAPVYPWAFVATPAYDGKVDVDYSQALAEAAFCAPLHGVKLTAAVMGNGAFIDLARNIFVKMFLEDNPDCTHLFFIDSDLKFPPNAFIGLMKADLPVCAGVYRRRQDPEDYPLSLADWPEGGGLWLDGDWVMANRVPTGFLCIRRDVVEEMAAEANQLGIHGQEGRVPQLFYTKLDDENRFIGEDFAFCDDYVKKYGKPIHVWPNIDFRHGGYDGNLFEWFDKKIGEAEAENTTSAA